MSYSPWGKIDTVSSIVRGISIVGTPSHGGLRVSRAALNKYAVDAEYLLKHAIPMGTYLFFEEDCDMPLALFDMPEVLRLYCAMRGQDEAKVFESFKTSVKHWHADYFDDRE